MSSYCASKHCYASLEDAQRHIAWMKRQAWYDGRTIHPYQCPDCSYVHAWRLPRPMVLAPPPCPHLEESDAP